jgi:twitching motility protein PilT
MVKVNSRPIDEWLRVVWNRGGTDLLLVAGSPPRVRIDGALAPIEGELELSGERIDAILHEILDPALRAQFENEHDVDFSFSWGDLARIRGNAYRQKTDVALALRIIPSKIPSFLELGLPPVATEMASMPRGLVLVTGPTGSGKSTTLAAIIEHINETRAVHVLTIEDPIEYVHTHKRAAISQREVGVDSPSFERALRSALREDPDVLLVGEMRDLETIQIALTMAETGHLVFATLHTNDAAQALDRIVDVFPGERQAQIRVQLAASLAAVVAQRLVQRPGGGLVAAFEVLLASHAARNLIREGKSNQLRNVMTMSQQDGMRTLEMSLADLVERSTITVEDAFAASAHPKELETALLAHTVGAGRL